MAFEVKYNAENGFVETTFSLKVSVEELYAEAAQSIGLSKKHGSAKFLCDASDAVANISIVHALKVERVQVTDELPRNARIAVVEPAHKITSMFVRFYELACLNRGWNVKVFKELQPAKDWLQAD